MSATVDFYFDFSSPYAYLGATQIARVVDEAGGTLVWKPFLLGGVFKAIGAPMVPLNEMGPKKRAYNTVDMMRWADWHGVALSWPTRFPMNTVKPLRIALALDAPQAWISRVFRAYWAEDQDISSPDVLAGLLDEMGMNASLLEKTADPAIKMKLREATEAAVAAGVFGAPTSIVTHEGSGERQLFWGQDRLEFVRRAVQGWSPTAS
ncbi:MAG: 2-hydroxychromene-2-carboxylate isomerase [Myxococcota bacterium]